ncbi:MAG: TIM barrel protein [Verrucomicrobiota bacterium]
MKRRDIVKATTLSAGFLAGSQVSLRAQEAENPKKHSFKLKYAPHLNTFKNLGGEDYVDQMKFAADRGFTAWEDNGFKKRSPEDQKRISKALEDLGMSMGVFVAHGSIGKTTFTIKDDAVWETVLQDIRDSVEVAKICGAKWMTVVPGNVDENSRNRLPLGYQRANVIELLRRCSEILEPHGLVMVLEPLNWFANHGGTFLQGSPQAYSLCKAVDSPSCKILFDIYHQQITEGNLIPNIKQSWDEIGYFQAGDNPGRKEPGTGEINYQNVFKYIYDRSKEEGQEFIIGMEHGNSMKGAEGEEAVISAYSSADSFVPAP